ncbi:hypothetical protein GTR04_1211 [Trichophyton interdigitale]|uniref:Uncharacterized protein n=1 Tax=Trichophyton interdigitale TaxID=101480 RepID=A0A9P5CZK6_9EURO|nr:hypothetical protein GY631_2482 [Trichophyton interdigitale]KAF3900510.1 hypothetical protein GY632_0728 [Trichophyton interdigitale]KAG8211372.1 hypothetical protein GTR04_1211 [Trichophyton interdigitale]
MAHSSAASRATLQCVSSSKLLIGLPEGTPQITYTNMKMLKNVIDAQARRCYRDDSQSPFLIVTSIPPSFPKEFEPDTNRRFTANLQEKILVVETTAKPSHALMAYELMQPIQRQIDGMGLHNELHGVHPFKVESTTGNWVKEGDGGFMRIDNLDWPIAAIEIGLSETESKLAIDAQGWLEAEGSRTEAVITAKLDRQTPRITVKRWQHYIPPFRPRTRHYNPIGSVMETVIVTHELGVTRVSNCLTIPFEKIFGRAKRGPNERDIVLSKDDLAEICELAWRAQGFI